MPLKLGTTPRSLSVIALEIREDWGFRVSIHAKPYLKAMSELHSIDDTYYADSARSVVSYFLANASSWRGEKARAIKAELNAMLKKGA